MFLSCCDKNCDDKWTKLVDWKKMANITLAAFSVFCSFRWGCHHKTKQLQVLRPDFKELQLILEKLVTRYQGVKSASPRTGLPPPTWDFQPCYVHLYYLFHHLIALALISREVVI